MAQTGKTGSQEARLTQNGQEMGERAKTGQMGVEKADET